MSPIRPQRSFFRSAGVLAGSTALSQLVALAATPVLTRLYGPTDFGLLAVFASIVSIAAVLASLRLEQAIPVPESDEEASHLVVLGFGAVGIVVAVAALLIGLGGEGLFHSLDAAQLAPLRWLLIPALVGASAYQILSFYAIRLGAYSEIARTRVSKNIAMIVTQAGLGLTGIGAVGLVLGEVANRIVGMSVLVKLSLQRLREGLRGSTISDVFETATRYWRYPALSAPSALVNVAGFQLPILLLSNLFESAVVGWFALSLRVLQAPVSMVSQAVGQVFFSEAGTHYREGTLPARVSEVTILLLRISVVPAMLVAVSGPDLFAWLFGQEWGIAGEYSQWLMPWLFLTLVTAPLSTIVFVLERQGTELLFQSALLVVRVGALWGGYLMGSSSAAVALFASTSCGMWAFYWVWLMRTAEADLGSITKTLLFEGIVAICVLAPYAVAKLSNMSAVWISISFGLSFLLAAAWSAKSLMDAWIAPSNSH